MFERKNKTIELFGKQLILAERNASDVIALSEYAQKNDDESVSSVVYKAVSILEASLRINYINLKWYQFFKQLKLRALLSPKYLINNLPQQQIFDLAKEVLELEGLIASSNEDQKKI